MHGVIETARLVVPRSRGDAGRCGWFHQEFQFSLMSNALGHELRLDQKAAQFGLGRMDYGLRA